jgi:predicted secreted protein
MCFMHKKYQVLFVVWFFIFPALSFAGDVSNFVLLGFSSDGHYMAFAQYGFDANKGQAYSSINTVDIKKNSFVPGTSLQKQLQMAAQNLPAFGDGVFYWLLEDNAKYRKQYGIDYLNRGRLLYMTSALSNMATAESFVLPKTESPIEFRDFQTKKNYQIILSQKATGQGSTMTSHMSAQLTISDGDQKKSYTLGNATFERKGVLGYMIDKMIVTPDNKSIVVVIARQEYGEDKTIRVRYMVETLSLS